MKRLIGIVFVYTMLLSGYMIAENGYNLTILYAATPIHATIGPALVNTFGNEGGFQCDPRDSGNYTPSGKLVGTKYGVCAKSYPNVDIPNLTLAGASKIYLSDFWDIAHCSEWRNQLIANTYFDAAVNLGQKTMAKIVQRAINYASYPQAHIPVDGVIGAATVKRLNQVDQAVLYVHMVGLIHNRYTQVVDANASKERYMNEWAIRLKRNVQKTVHEYEVLRAAH